jgi:hypothetical protein
MLDRSIRIATTTGDAILAEAPEVAARIVRRLIDEA